MHCFCEQYQACLNHSEFCTTSDHFKIAHIQEHVDLGLNPAGFRVDPSGFRVDPAGFRVDPVGFRADPVGFRA